MGFFLESMMACGIYKSPEEGNIISKPNPFLIENTSQRLLEKGKPFLWVVYFSDNSMSFSPFQHNSYITMSNVWCGDTTEIFLQVSDYYPNQVHHNGDICIKQSAILMGCTLCEWCNIICK